MGEVANLPAGSNGTELMAMVFDPKGWKPEAAAELADQIPAVKARMKAMAVPLQTSEPNGLVDGRRGPKTNKLLQSLRLVGAKISPTMSEEQVNVWITAVAMALSDLSYGFALKGAADALHVPMKFLNEVEEVVREKAELARIRHAGAMHRLRTLERQLEAASEPALPAPEEREMTQDEINALSPAFLRLGLKAGFLSQEQYDIAIMKDDK